MVLTPEQSMFWLKTGGQILGVALACYFMFRKPKNKSQEDKK